MIDEPHEIRISLKDFDLSQLPEKQRGLDGDELRQAVREHFEKKFIGVTGASAVAVTQDTIILRWASETPLQPLADRGVDLLGRGDYERGIAMLEAALLVDADDEVVLFNLGMALSDKGKLEDAKGYLNRFLELNPAHANAWIALGVAQARSQELGPAIESLKQAVSLDAGNVYALKNLGALQIEVEGAESDAKKNLKEAATLMPADQQIWVNLGKLHEKMGDLEDADEAYLKALEIDSNNQLAAIAESGRSRIAEQVFRDRGEGTRPDATMYCLSALEMFAGMDRQEVQKITFEIATLGMGGLDVNDPAQKYSLQSLPGKFSGLQLLCIEYVGFQQLDPSVDLGFDLSTEYSQAKVLLSGKS